MEELFSGPATFLDDVCALATTGGKGFANILEEVNKEYEKEVVAELERLQLSRGNPESSKNDVEAADCEELEDAYDLLFKDGEKPVPIRDFTEIKENSSGTKTKTFKNIPKQYSHVEEFNKFKLKMNQKQVAAKQSIPQGVMTRSQEEATAILKKLASEGELYALQKYQGGMRSAKITYSKDKLLLHRLRKKHPPSGVSVVCHNDVMKLVDPSSRLTFLFLGEKDYINFGKVFIRLHGDTLAAKHFSCLCTGERGPTYAGFTCVDVFNKNHKTLEYFRMGDYENCNGTGGKPLFQV
ncbi:uncharacterized protein [Macrobrachium rosenbergii]|uniref:uncharacterized protein isoform X1 n=1 Tax=Macrobrachium rosenbergii TaxID=79674 RepID=UPI0034D4CE45